MDQIKKIFIHSRNFKEYEYLFSLPRKIKLKNNSVNSSRFHLKLFRSELYLFWSDVIVNIA